jgi:hypothetical protein
MKIKEGFAKRNIAGAEIVVPVGKTAMQFNGMITLNETGAFIWDCLKEDCSEEKIVEKMLAEYDVSAEKAAADVAKFTAMLKENGLIEE